MNDNYKEKRGPGKPIVHPKVLCRETGIIFTSYTDAAASIGGSRYGVRKCCEGTQRHHHGYHFKWV